jgi:hypothetical protein
MLQFFVDAVSAPESVHHLYPHAEVRVLPAGAFINEHSNAVSTLPQRACIEAYTPLFD